MYKVIRFFTDLEDNNYPYEVGSTYPREGLNVSKSRIKELSGPNNKQRIALIVAVGESEEDAAEGPVKEVATEEAAEKKPATKTGTRSRATKKKDK